MEYKEMIIPRPRGRSFSQLILNGKWIEKLGFTVGKNVNVSFQDSCLTLSTNTAAPINYSTLQVISKLMRGKPRTQLLLDGFLLIKCGFKAGDRIGLTLSPNMIQISKINRFVLDEGS